MSEIRARSFRFVSLRLRGHEFFREQALSENDAL